MSNRDEDRVWAELIAEATMQPFDVSGSVYRAGIKEALVKSLLAALERSRNESLGETAKAIEFAVEYTIKQLSQRDEWPHSWAAGFPSFKASALIAYSQWLVEIEKRGGLQALRRAEALGR
jgi:hypothetical protein